MIEAIVVRHNAGYDIEREHVQEYGLDIGNRYEVEYFSMGQSSTSIRLKDLPGSWNSVFFEFEEDGAPLDIYEDPRFNHYISCSSLKDGV